MIFTKMQRGGVALVVEISSRGRRKWNEEWSYAVSTAEESKASIREFEQRLWEDLCEGICPRTRALNNTPISISEKWANEMLIAALAFRE